MTLASTVSKISYAGNGSTSAFAVPFMFVQDDDIEVVVLDVGGVEHFKTISTDYTLSGAGGQTGGVCTMIAAPANGETLTIRRNPEIVQEVDYVENDAFPAATHEAALDKLTMICQALAERLDRAVSSRVSSASIGIEMPEPEADRLLVWNGAGDNLDNGPTATEVSNAQGYAEVAASAQAAAETARDIAVAAAEAIPGDPLDSSAIGDTVEPFDENRANRLYANVAARLSALFTDTVQAHSGASLSGFVPTSNEIEWILTGASTFDELSSSAPMTLVFYITPNGYDLSFSSAWTPYGEDYDPTATEVRVTVRVNGSKKRVTIANAKVAA